MTETPGRASETRADVAMAPLFKSPEGEARFMAAYDAVLREWPVPFEELDIPTRLGRTHVIASGPKAAPALFLLHSMAGTATLWRPNVAALSSRYRVYAVDTPGQVGKSVATRKIGSRHDMADWFADLLDGLGQKSASIVGSSHGGFLALNQASLTPDRVERVVLISPAATFMPLSAGFIFAMLIKPMLRRLLGRQAPRDITTLLGKGQTLSPADAAWGRLMSITMADSARPNLASPIVFSRAELAAIRAPTLLLVGEQEILYDARAAVKRARQRMPQVTAAIIPDAHHLGALARPDEVNARLLAFLGEEERPATASLA